MTTTSERLRTVFLAIIAGVGLVAPASAGQLTYTPVNPNFGGSPFNGAPLLSSAQVQNTHTDGSGRSDRRDPITQFTETLQARLLAQVSNDIVNSIFGDNAQNAGLFTVGDTQIAFERAGGTVNVTINDLLSGATTTIELPVVASD